jgi:putative membrane protein
MVAWDFAQDPTWANFVHGWQWHEGGAYFGVPLSNFAGWYLTVYLIYQSFSLAVRWKSGPFPASFWRTAILFYAVSAAGNLLVPGPRGVTTVTDAAGTVWPVSGITATSTLVSVLAMGAFAVLAWVRLLDSNPDCGRGR